MDYDIDFKELFKSIESDMDNFLHTPLGMDDVVLLHEVAKRFTWLTQDDITIGVPRFKLWLECILTGFDNTYTFDGIKILFKSYANSTSSKMYGDRMQNARTFPCLEIQIKGNEDYIILVEILYGKIVYINCNGTIELDIGEGMLEPSINIKKVVLLNRIN